MELFITGLYLLCNIYFRILISINSFVIFTGYVKHILRKIPNSVALVFYQTGFLLIIYFNIPLILNELILLVHPGIPFAFLPFKMSSSSPCPEDYQFNFQAASHQIEQIKPFRLKRNHVYRLIIIALPMLLTKGPIPPGNKQIMPLHSNRAF